MTPNIEIKWYSSHWIMVLLSGGEYIVFVSTDRRSKYKLDITASRLHKEHHLQSKLLVPLSTNELDKSISMLDSIELDVNLVRFT